MPCETCDCSHLPICAGESCPELCRPAHAEMRRKLSMDASRAVGWPNVGRAPTRSLESLLISGPEYVHPSEMQGPDPDGEIRVIDWAESPKPRISLGVNQRSVAPCLPCVAARDRASSIRHRGPLMAAREMVVARYSEDVAWLAASPMKVTLYDGGPVLPRVIPPQVARVAKRNVGREAYSYLRYITERYDSLPDLTFFTQADPFDHSPDFLARLGGRFDSPTSLTTQYLHDRPARWIKAQDRAEVVNGHEVRYGDARINGHGTAGTSHPANARGWFNDAAWPYVFDCPIPRPLWFGYAASYAVPRDSILARPLAFWRWLKAELERPECSSGSSSWTDPPINPWTMEALWFSLFQSPEIYPHRPDRMLD